MRRTLALMALCILPFAATAEETKPDFATLVADSVSVGDNRRLVATGHVEVLYGDIRLTAPRVAYDRENDTLSIDGPIRVTTENDTVILASAAELSPDLAEGILYSARMVMDRELQIAAADIQRMGGRYTVLNKTVASVCRICSESQEPLWQIRAERVIHDEERQRLFFTNARLELLGVPVFYLPRLSIPDPSLKRATGFLSPKIRTSDILGTGVKIPYFIAIGDHQDVTLTPYVSEETRTLEWRYRRAFRAGDIELNGAFSNDDLKQTSTRAFLFAEGTFDLPKDFTLEFDLKMVSDPDYLFDYDFSDDNRLENTISINRTRKDELIQGDLAYFEPLRDTATDSSNPARTGDVSYRRRFVPPVIGGIAGFTLSGRGAYRNSSQDTDGSDYDSYGDGMDVTRVSAGLDWRGDHVFSNGMVLAAIGAVDMDLYYVNDDIELEGTHTRITPAAALELRWPFAASTASGGTHVLEPLLQLAWSDQDDGNIPDEDSILLEFDEANLTALSRFPGEDAREAGLRASIGLGWTWTDPSGWSVGTTVGRILRAEDLGQFSQGSGLDGLTSDWMSVLQLSLPSNLLLWNRTLFDDSYDVTKTDLRVNWTPGRFALGTSYTWIAPDASVGRNDKVSEWELEASYQFHDYWTGRTDWRYDAVERNYYDAGVGLMFQNDCLTVDLSVSRRFSSSTTRRESTDFALLVQFAGFGSSSSGTAQARRCTRF
ncbi:Outer membrane protein Imp, required for envelope biogenesis [Rhodovulum sp. P5]|uniref:LPS-assembly protein LptD n=1 Tax=Rhodovulum sp. P5 TaxID=1564506 RepID=UPI0009C2BFBA|nr:LPS assembly protein LptD [Rhodovulum sp. P5]ARE39652.1 Outer membrane protein Imp, required for envelope biogenesis [Rhodovulum sp. P5]